MVDYLNEKTERTGRSKYLVTNKNTIKCIKARLKEGYVLEDFKEVVDNKCEEWKGTEWEKFLRPETLFGNKFEGYLKQKASNMREYKKKETDEFTGVTNESIKNLLGGLVNQ